MLQRTNTGLISWRVLYEMESTPGKKVLVSWIHKGKLSKWLHKLPLSKSIQPFLPSIPASWNSIIPPSSRQPDTEYISSISTIFKSRNAGNRQWEETRCGCLLFSRIAIKIWSSPKSQGCIHGVGTSVQCVYCVCIHCARRWFQRKTTLKLVRLFHVGHTSIQHRLLHPRSLFYKNRMSQMNVSIQNVFLWPEK